MENEIVEKLKQKMTEFEDEDVYIELENSMQYHTTIKNAKIIVSDEKLIISNEKEKDYNCKYYNNINYIDSIFRI